MLRKIALAGNLVLLCLFFTGLALFGFPSDTKRWLLVFLIATVPTVNIFALLKG